MSEDKPLKILVSGDVEGRLNDLYSKVKSIQNKVGKFDYLFCVGEFFAESPQDNKEIEEYCSNPSSIPIQTYVLGTGKKSREKYFLDKSGCDICPDKIIYLGSRGYYSTFQGLSLVYLSGYEGSEKSEAAKKIKSEDESCLVEFSASDVESLIGTCEKRHPGECIDLLLTNQWPKYVENLSNQELENNQKSESFGSDQVSFLNMRIKPRYHFSANQNIYFERTPYRNHRMLKEKEKHLTRFLALAKVNKSNKPKYLYAFNITPSKNLEYRDVIKHSAANLATDNPFMDQLEISRDGSLLTNTSRLREETSSFFYDNDYIKKMNELQEIEMAKARRRMEMAANKEREPCWFCLGGSKIERQYIVGSIYFKCYLAYAKGALNKDHLLIIPIDHVQSSVNCDQELLDEIDKFKKALKSYFGSRGKCVLFYERNFRSTHMQIQVFAIRADKSYLLKDAFMSAAKDQDVYLNEIPEFTNLKQVLRPNQAFFYLELPADEDFDPKRKRKADDKANSYERYLCEIRGHFPINFGRDVMASELILNCPDRVDWKDCVKSLEEEKQMTLEFRNSFKQFDPSI